jgi:hypothetical protein
LSANNKIKLAGWRLSAVGTAMLITAANLSTLAQQSYDQSSSGAKLKMIGSNGAADSNAAEAELAKKLQNPVANLVSVPIQNNWDFGIGPADAMKYTANIQPVTPITLNKDWNLIIRTIMPVIYQEATINNPLAPASASQDHYGLGDITQSFFLSPQQPVGGWILGAGPVALWPVATDSALGLGKWGAGPTVVVLRQEHGFTYGMLVNQIWSFAGWGAQNVSATFIQPFLSYTTKSYTTLGVSTESTRNWQAEQWSVPVNFTVQQLLKIGKQPVAFQIGYRYYAEGPNGGPAWGLRFTVTFLFPK